MSAGAGGPPPAAAAAPAASCTSTRQGALCGQVVCAAGQTRRCTPVACAWTRCCAQAKEGGAGSAQLHTATQWEDQCAQASGAPAATAVAATATAWVGSSHLRCRLGFADPHACATAAAGPASPRDVEQGCPFAADRCVPGRLTGATLLPGLQCAAVRKPAPVQLLSVQSLLRTWGTRAGVPWALLNRMSHSSPWAQQPPACLTECLETCHPHSQLGHGCSCAAMCRPRSTSAPAA